MAYQELKEREHRAARLGGMALEMAYQKEVSHARGHKRKLKPGKNEEEVLPGLAHLQKGSARIQVEEGEEKVMAKAQPGGVACIAQP